METRELQDEGAHEMTLGRGPGGSVTSRLVAAAMAGPGGTPALRVVTTLLLVVGAVLAAWSGAIHIKLWNDGYSTIPTIGPLFLFQGIVGVLLAIALVATRRLVVVAATAGFMIATIGGLLITVYYGLFGFVDSFGAPYAGLSLTVEAAGAVVLAFAGILLGWGVRAGSGSQPASDGRA